LKAFYKDNHRTLYCKDCRSMSELDNDSVHCVTTSPPYWGLRKYSGDQDLIWGNENCEHKWAEYKRPPSGGHPSNSAQVGSTKADVQRVFDGKASWCSLCGAWRGAYGLEPTPKMYVQHTVEILREIKRVLRKDGVVFWNIGDSYAGGKGQSGSRGPEYQDARHKSGESLNTNYQTLGGAKQTRPTDDRAALRSNHIKPLDLCLIPERLASALQEDGWWVRSIIIWYKPNPMPESVNGWRWERHRIHLKARTRGSRDGATPSQEHHPGQVPHRDGSFSEPTDSQWQECPGCPKCSPNDGYVLRKGSWRPTDSYEQILMLAKTNSYYCDAEAVREAYTKPMNRWGGETLKRDTSKTAEYKEIQNIGYSSAFRVGRPMWPDPSGRNLRNVWSFPTVPYPGAHFAVFPEKLPELCIKAVTPEVGVCAKCGAPWARVVEAGFREHDGTTKSKSDPGDKSNEGAYGRLALLRQAARERGFEYSNETKTLGWRPTCSCNCPDKVPATILDPFAGAGTTLLVAAELGRKAIGYEISEKYCQLIVDRNKQHVLLMTK